MSLPSLLDVAIVIVLVIPGFIAYSMMRFIGPVVRKLPEFETIIWSLLLSLVIYGIFAYATGITDFETLRDTILRPDILATLVVDTLLVGAVLGLFWHLAVYKGNRPIIGDPWDVFFDSMREEGRDLVVFTEKGQEFRGWVGYSGTEDDRLELTLVSPKLVIRDDDWNIKQEIPYGDRMLFMQDDIRRIAQLKKRPDA